MRLNDFVAAMIVNPLYFFTSPTSPRGRQMRVNKLVDEGWSEERAWAVVFTRDIERGAKNFTDEEKNRAAYIRERGVPLS